MLKKTNNFKNKFLSKSKLSLIIVCSLASLNVMAAQTGWKLNFSGGLRDIQVKSIDIAGANAFNSIDKKLSGGIGTIEVIDSYGNAGSIKLGVYDASNSAVIGTLILTQSDYSGSMPTSVPSNFGSDVAGLPYDICQHLDADNLNIS